MYEIPKIRVPLEITMSSGESIPGTVFITSDLVDQYGEANLDEFLNREGDTFIPFEGSDGLYRLFNKHQLSFLRSTQDDSRIQSQTLLEPKRLEIYFTNGQNLGGVVYPTQAEESRVSDLLNVPQRFIAIYHHAYKVLINRDHVVYVKNF